MAGTEPFPSGGRSIFPRGPDGGDGGRGGDIIFEADPGMKTMDFRYRKHYRAENSQNSAGYNRTGKNREDLVLKVPVVLP